MNRRKFITRVCQIAVGGAAAAEAVFTAEKATAVEGPTARTACPAGLLRTWRR
jgi:hypothetical protein